MFEYGRFVHVDLYFRTIIYLVYLLFGMASLHLCRLVYQPYRM